MTKQLQNIQELINNGQVEIINDPVEAKKLMNKSVGIRAGGRQDTYDPTVKVPQDVKL